VCVTYLLHDGPIFLQIDLFSLNTMLVSVVLSVPHRKWLQLCQKER